MELEKARKMVAHIIEQRLRWGKLYADDRAGKFEFRVSELLDALVEISKADNERLSGIGNEVDEALQALHDAEVLHARQMGAAKSREKKMQKTVEKLREQINGLEAQLSAANRERDAAVDGLHSIADEVRSSRPDERGDTDVT